MSAAIDHGMPVGPPSVHRGLANAGARSHGFHRHGARAASSSNAVAAARMACLAPRSRRPPPTQLPGRSLTGRVIYITYRNVIEEYARQDQIVLRTIHDNAHSGPHASLSPYLIVRNAPAAIDFTRRRSDKGAVSPGEPSGKVGHAERRSRPCAPPARGRVPRLRRAQSGFGRWHAGSDSLVRRGRRCGGGARHRCWCNRPPRAS